MNDRDHELFETELHRLKLARPPEDFMARLAATPPPPRIQAEHHSRAGRKAPAWWWFRWLAPLAASAALVAALVPWQQSNSPTSSHAQPAVASARRAPKADDVEIDRQLVAAYGAVVQLPTGEPVRLLCREWRDEVILRDPVKGIVIERQTPRLEIVPVSFDTY